LLKNTDLYDIEWFVARLTLISPNLFGWMPSADEGILLWGSGIGDVKTIFRGKEGMNPI
jgi:hypothetical protein